MAKGHVALLIMHVDQRISIHSYLIRFLDQISAIGVAENKLAVMKVLFEGLDRLLMHDDYFECGEHLLVGEDSHAHCNSRRFLIKTIHSPRFLAL